MLGSTGNNARVTKEKMEPGKVLEVLVLGVGAGEHNNGACNKKRWSRGRCWRC